MNLKLYNSLDKAQLAAFFERYLQVIPDAKLNDADFYTYHPALKDGKNVFCVVDPAQQIIGFAPVSPVIVKGETGPDELVDIWTIILAQPELEAGNEIRQLLFDAVLERANQLKSEYGKESIRLAADMMASQQMDIDFLLKKGFAPFEQVVVMSRVLALPIPSYSFPQGIFFRPSKLDTLEDQMEYLGVYTACFPEKPKSHEELLFLLDSPLWENGWVFSAYSPAEELVGSILIYRDHKGSFITDDVMVLPEWRGKNIARALIAEGLQYLQAQGAQEVVLEVLENNTPARSVYASMGYREINREVLLQKFV